MVKIVTKVTSLFLIVTLITAALSLVTATANSTELYYDNTFANENVLNKLHFYFTDAEYLTIDDSNELADALDSVRTFQKNANVFSINAESEVEVEVQVMVEFASNYFLSDEYREFSNERKELKTSEDVLAFRKRLNAFSKEYHNNIIDMNISALSVLDWSSFEPIEYSPFVKIKVNANNLNDEVLKNLCNNDSIVNMSISYEPVADSTASWSSCVEAMNAYEILSNSTYTGLGIRIGIYEADGVCNVNHINLRDKNITIQNAPYWIDDHATQVTSVLTTIAPDAEYYVAVADNNAIGLQWFIDQYCDIVNCSFSYLSNVYNSISQTYSEGIREYRYDIDAVYDYQILAHYITVCTSAGNVIQDNTKEAYNPEGKIASPGHSYNAITVGGVDLNASGQWIYATGASWQSSSLLFKPNVSAPFIVNIPNIGVKSGTSYSAPQVSGCIALFLESDPGCRAAQERLIALINATANQTADYFSIDGFDYCIGAGIINLDGMIANNSFIPLVNTNRNAGVAVIEQSVYLSAGTTIQIGLAWLVTVDIENEQAYVTDYNLEVYDPYGILMIETYASDSNMRKITTSVNQSGMYKIVVYQNSNMNNNIAYDEMTLVYDY